MFHRTYFLFVITVDCSAGVSFFCGWVCLSICLQYGSAVEVKFGGFYGSHLICIIVCHCHCACCQTCHLYTDWLTGWLKGRNQRTSEEGLFPAGEFVKFIPSVKSVMRPPVPKPRARYTAKLDDSGYETSPRGICSVLIVCKSWNLKHVEQLHVM